MWLEILLILFLLGVVYQDFTTRSVHVLFFIGLIIVAILYALKFQGWPGLLSDVVVNLCFVSIQILAVFGYFRLKFGNQQKILNHYLGVGDLVFFLPVVIIFPLINFIAFYMTSLIIILFIAILHRIFGNQKTATIPLAGGQALCLILLILYCIWRNVNLTDQSWFYLLGFET